MSIVILNDFFGKTKAIDRQFDLYFSNYETTDLDNANANDKNFLYMYYRPDSFHEVISSMDGLFYKKVKEKNCNILIYHEGFDLFRIPEIFDSPLPLDINNEPYWKMVNFFSKHGITEDKLYFITSAIGYEQDLELLKQRKIPWIKDLRPAQAKFCTLNIWLLWGSKQKKIMVKEKSFDKLYSSLANGRPAQHRYEFTKKLWQQGLITNGVVSMCHMSAGDEEFESNLPMILDGKDNTWSDNIDENFLFDNVFLWVSNETHMDNKLTLFSEKTIRPMLYMNPFVINGDAHTLAYLKSLGFRTFDEFWDESYDTITDQSRRQDKIISIIKDLRDENLEELYNKMKPTLEHNRNLLMNTDFLQILRNFLTSENNT